MVAELNLNPSKVPLLPGGGGTKITLTPAVPSNGEANGKIRSDQLAVIKTSLLTPNEVTFCVDDGRSYGSNSTVTPTTTPAKSNHNRRDEFSDTDSIASTVTTTASRRKPAIPDGGFGWVVVGASFFVSLIADGISFSFGLIYTELLHNLDVSPSKLAWVGSLFLAVPLMSGPVLSNLVDKYGCRKMTMIGGCLACTGFVMASLSTSVEFLYLTFGILAGFGLGVGYVTAVVSIAFWFDKRRTFATGIGASGTGLGTFIVAPLTQWLITHYGWRGATLILAGILFNMCVCGALMRDPDWLIEENLLESRSESVQTFSPQASNLCLDEIKKLIETGAAKEDILDTLVTNVNTEANQKIGAESDIVAPRKYLSEVFLPTYLADSHDLEQLQEKRYPSRRSLKQAFLPREPVSGISDDQSRQTCTLASAETLDTWEKIASDESISIISEPQQSINDVYGPNLHKNIAHGSRFSLDETLILKKPIDRFKQELERGMRGASLDVVRENEIFNPNPERMPIGFSSDDMRASMPTETLLLEKARKRRNHTEPPMGLRKQRPTLKYPNYFRNMRIHRNSIHYRGAMLNTHRYRLRASSCPNIYRNSMTTIAKEEEEKWYDDFIDIIKSIFDFSLFKDFKFSMMSLSTFVLFVWFIIPYFYITEHMLKFGYKEEDSAILISVIGIFNTIGMVVLGWVGDQPWANVTRVYGHCLVGCGISVICMPLVVETYWALVVMCILFGLTFASSFSFTPIILVRIVSLEDFTCAYGLILLVQGVGNLLGPPFAGLIYDLTKRWDDTFYAAGGFIVVSGLLAYVIGRLDPVDDDDEDEE